MAAKRGGICLLPSILVAMKFTSCSFCFHRTPSRRICCPLTLDYFSFVTSPELHSPEGGTSYRLLSDTLIAD